MTEVQLRQLVRIALYGLDRETLERLGREASEAGDRLRASVVSDLLAERRVASGVPGGRLVGSFLSVKGE